MPHSIHIPRNIENAEQLEDLLSTPTAAVVETMRRLEGDLIILGVGGKMGPTLARMARRAADAAGISRRIYGVARFTSGGLIDELAKHGIEPIRCDLLDRHELAQLPDAPHVLYMVARKFGSTGEESLTWAVNSLLPGMVCEKFAGSRIVAFSTGNVYAFTTPESGGSLETDRPAPVGEYAMSCLGRERMFEYFSRTQDLPVSILRLNYAHELRYGVMVDLAAKIARGEPVDLTMGYFNAIWQGDANARVLQSLAHAASPPLVINIAGSETLRVREVCQQLGKRVNREPIFSGEESPTALLSNATRAAELFDPPAVSPDRMIDWIAHWIRQGGELLDKPTHFQVRDGRF